ncbi:hypothetical protein GQ457_06G011500 [Hibiscus cannabinus]
MRMRDKDIHVMQSHMLFRHSNNNNNHDNIHSTRNLSRRIRQNPQPLTPEIGHGTKNVEQGSVGSNQMWTLFVSNLSDQIHLKGLWHVFYRHEFFVDSFISRKRTANGSCFGFGIVGKERKRCVLEAEKKSDDGENGAVEPGSGYFEIRFYRKCYGCDPTRVFGPSGV